MNTAHRFFRTLSREKFSRSAGFDLRSLPHLFDFKSTATKDKSAYHIIMKLYLHSQDPDTYNKLKQMKADVQLWKLVPETVFDDAMISLAKKLHPPYKLMSQLG